MNTHEKGKWVAVGIVTYGDRWRFLEKVLERVIDDPCVGAIWVVDNGSLHSTSSAVELNGWSHRVNVMRNEENLGSAGGYGQVLMALEQYTDAPLLYLLDDDNRPEANAISVALESWLQFGSDPNNCFLSLRSDRPEQLVALNTGTPLRNRANSFMGFHVADKCIRFFKQRDPDQNTACSMVDVEYAPYGGLLLHRSWLARVGLPNKAYYLYADDHEFTVRITSHNGRILLLNESRVEDIESSWHLKSTAARVGMFSASSPKLRLYYSIRNRVDFERRTLISSHLMYAINVSASLLIRFVAAVVLERKLLEPSRNLSIAVQAIRDGWITRLGKVEEVF